MQTTQNNYNYGKKFRKYTYSSIPISFCILALLVVGWSMISPSIINTSNVVSAMEEDSSMESSDTSSINTNDSTQNSDSGTDDSGIMPLAYNPSASLTVSNTNLTTQTVPGEVAYLSSNVTYSANDIESYNLKISYASGSNALKGDSSSATTITGAGGKTPASMSSNSWGYALADTNANNTTLTYNTMPAYGSAATIVSGNAESVPTTTKKLVFASKFATNANPGHYRTKVLLSLTATPRKLITLSQITTMQQMATQICTDSNVGESKSLTDARDNEKYMVRKHEDGHCWMTENLRITGPRTLTPADSDVSKNYTLPKSDLNGFNNSNYYANQLYYDGNKANGAYYSWTAATAGTGNSSLTNGDASSSICPKGWRLPPNSGKGSYVEFLKAASIANSATGSAKIQASPYNFPLSGRIYDGAFDNVGSGGYYWTQSAFDITGAYDLYINSTSVRGGHYYRFPGRSVRCVMIGG